MMADGGKQLQRFAIGAAAAAQTLAINGQGLEDGNFLRHHPLANAQVKIDRIQAVDDAKEGAVAGRAVELGDRVAATTQGSQLPLTEFLALILKSLVAAGSHE